eukprot:546999-Pleurochrysis_carterae.AAC.1
MVEQEIYTALQRLTSRGGADFEEHGHRCGPSRTRLKLFSRYCSIRPCSLRETWLAPWPVEKTIAEDDRAPSLGGALGSGSDLSSSAHTVINYTFQNPRNGCPRSTGAYILARGAFTLPYLISEAII